MNDIPKLFRLLACCLVGSSLIASSSPACLGQVAPRQQMMRQIQLRQVNGGAIEFGGLNNLNVIRLNGGGLVGGQQDAMEFEHGGVLKTDPDLESIMEKAERFRKDGNYRVATQLWQAVLERSGDALFSVDGDLFFSISRQVEKVLSELPPEGLQAYRIKADAEAKAILAQAAGPDDRVALNRVIRNFFLSSEGDEAALRLGSLYLEDYDFHGARRVLEKIVDHYPDPSVSMADVHARIAVCDAFLGDVESARTALDKAQQATPRHRPAELVAAAIDQEAALNAGHGSRNGRQQQWSLPLADMRRTGVAPAPPKEFYENDLVAIWQFFYEPRDRYNDADDLIDHVLVADESHDEELIATTRNLTERKMLEAWAEKGWQPVGQLVFSGNQVHFKTGGDLVSFDRRRIGQPPSSKSNAQTAGAEDDNKPQVSDYLAWRSVWHNCFEVDAATQMKQAILKNYGQVSGRTNRNSGSLDYPDSADEVRSFGDAIASQLSVHRGVVFSIEGEHFDQRLATSSRRIVPQWNQPYRRTRENTLTAYDANSGMLMWSLPKTDAKRNQDGQAADGQRTPEFLDDGGFMAAPVGYNNLAIVPVNKGGTIMVYGLDIDSGKTVWKSYLCDEPESGAVAWSPINLSIDGSDLLVNSGLGVTFSLDPATGVIRFAKRYARIGKPDSFYQRSNWSTQRATFDGWKSDVVIPFGRQLVRFASDSNVIEAIDRDSAELVWRSEMNPIGFEVDYLLGVYNDTLYAAGPETIIAYDLAGEGRMVWGADQLFDGKQSLGHGLLTPEGIFIPVQDKLYHFALEGDGGRAKLLNKIHVDLGGAPIGNLFSDGERFWVHGANRLYALGVPAE